MVVRMFCHKFYTGLSGTSGRGNDKHETQVNDELKTLSSLAKMAASSTVNMDKVYRNSFDFIHSRQKMAYFWQFWKIDTPSNSSSVLLFDKCSYFLIQIMIDRLSQFMVVKSHQDQRLTFPLSCPEAGDLDPSGDIPDDLKGYEGLPGDFIDALKE